jgi:hypothetical protein
VSSVDYEKYKINGELPQWAQSFQKFEKILEPALKYADTHGMQDFADGVENGTMQLWHGEKSAIVTEIHDYPLKKVILVSIAGGDIRELEEIAPHIVKFAQHMGCNRIVLAGRRGWSRTFLRNMAFKPTHYWMSKEL